MELALLIDFGSTYTKVTAVDLGSELIIGTARAFSTVKTDIMEGFLKAVKELEASADLENPPYKYKLACSSAAGGLRMAAIGLVPDLTTEAARRAALGAGARVTGVFAHELSLTDMGKLEGQEPDILLLAGGTDGGNRDVIIHNARKLAESAIASPIVFAGNRSAAEEAADMLLRGGKDVRVTENVMPELGVLNIDPARETIRQVFLEKIVAAKGLKKAENYIDRVLMPTPAAVLSAAELLARGCGEEEGLGDLMVVDPGGATTDVHSVAGGEPTKAGVSLKGLPEPYAKRTVEGDLGMRYSARSLLETAGLRRLSQCCSLEGEVIERHIENICTDPALLSSVDTARIIDDAIGFTAVEIAVERHVGRIESIYTPFGVSYAQTGKDLTEISYLIGTGGIIVFHDEPGILMKGALFDQNRPEVLKPVRPKLLIDRSYIMAGMGLLAEVDARVSFRLLKKYLVGAQIAIPENKEGCS